MGSHFQQQNHKFYLDLEGQPVGRPVEVSASQDVEEAVTKTGFAVKHISNLRQSHIDLSLGANMGTVLHQWIKDTLNKSYDRKNGSIAVEDGAKKTVRTIEFHRTLIESIVLPSLDKASKDTEFLKLKLIPENLKFGNTGEKLDQKKAIKYGTPQPFDRGHFKLTITGLATECAAVSKIDSITIKQGTTADATGDQRSPHIEPTRLDESHLVIILPMSSAKGFLNWQQKTIEDGMASSNETKSGSLQYFAIGSTSSRFVLNFDGLGLASMSATKETDKNNNKDAKFALYYSSVALQAN